MLSTAQMHRRMPGRQDCAANGSSSPATAAHATRHASENRVILLDDEVKPDAGLIKRYEGTAWVSAKSLPWLSKFPLPAQGTTDGRAYFYAVDPLGNIFMRYGADADVKLIVKDLQRVLKASQIG
jgi:cytochrome oxidase Cu insertion factor (SCO1/SenC/PrrC family)